MNTILPRKFYDRDTALVARDLLGALLVHVLDGQALVGIITETEAYGYDDPASHAYRGKTKTNTALFGPVGHAYIYRSYGLHICFDVVAYDTQHASAGGVLIRSIVPTSGIEIMRERRNNKKNIAQGPGNVTQALGLTMDDNNVDLTKVSSGLYIKSGNKVSVEDITISTRIGISKNKEILWRFILQKQS